MARKLPQLIPYGVPRVDVMRAMATDAYCDLPTHPGNPQNALKVDDKFWVENGEKLERIFGIYVQLYISNPMTDTVLAQADGLIWRDHSFCIVSYCTETRAPHYWAKSNAAFNPRIGVGCPGIWRTHNLAAAPRSNTFSPSMISAESADRLASARFFTLPSVDRSRATARLAVSCDCGRIQYTWHL